MIDKPLKLESGDTGTVEYVPSELSRALDKLITPGGVSWPTQDELVKAMEGILDTIKSCMDDAGVLREIPTGPARRLLKLSKESLTGKVACGNGFIKILRHRGEE